MEFLEGEPLAEPLRKGALPLNEVFKDGIAVAEARPLSARPQHRICPPPLRCGGTGRGQRSSGRNPPIGCRRNTAVLDLRRIRANCSTMLLLETTRTGKQAEAGPNRLVRR